MTATNQHQTPQLAAFIDESYEISKRRRFYLMAAVYTDVTSREYKKLATDLKTLARDYNLTEIHAADTRHDDHTARIVPEVLERIAGVESMGQIVVVKAPVDRGAEQARQSCLRLLARHLAREGVTQLQLDTRDRVGPRRRTFRNRIDRDTIASTPQTQHMHVRHLPSDRTAGLWVADVVANTVGRVFKYGEIEEASMLAGHLRIYPDASDPVLQAAGDPRSRATPGVQFVRYIHTVGFAINQAADDQYRTTQSDAWLTADYRYRLEHNLTTNPDLSPPPGIGL